MKKLNGRGFILKTPWLWKVNTPSRDRQTAGVNSADQTWIHSVSLFSFFTLTLHHLQLVPPLTLLAPLSFSSSLSSFFCPSHNLSLFLSSSNFPTSFVYFLTTYNSLSLFSSMNYRWISLSPSGWRRKLLPYCVCVCVWGCSVLPWKCWSMCVTVWVCACVLRPLCFPACTGGS